MTGGFDVQVDHVADARALLERVEAMLALDHVALLALAKDTNDTIMKDEGFDPVGEEWLMRILTRAYEIGVSRGMGATKEWLKTSSHLNARSAT